MARLRMRIREFNDNLYCLQVLDSSKCSFDLKVSVLQLSLIFNCKTLLRGSDIQTPFIDGNVMEAAVIFLR